MSGQVQKAVESLTGAVQSDPEYAWAWHCNIAMCSVDGGNGFAARALRYHLQQLEPQLPDEGSAAVMCDRCGVRPKTRSTQADGCFWHSCDECANAA